MKQFIEYRGIIYFNIKMMSKLDLFGKGISSIQYIRNSHDYKEVDLSHNAIASLDNIDQFQNVHLLNISHNHIISGKELIKLKSLKKLRTLLIKGNPFLKSK